MSDNVGSLDRHPLFELTALILLILNLWFVIEVLKVLRAVKDALLLLGNLFDRSKK